MKMKPEDIKAGGACMASMDHLIRRPIIRSVMMISFLVYFIVSVVTSPVGTSHLSHVGGFISGLFPALLFLPHLRSEK